MPFGLFGPKVGHPALYNDLCKLHAFDRPTKALLDHIIQTFDLKQPSMIFVDINVFKKAIVHASFTSQEDLIRELCFKWFGRRI